MGAVSAAGQGVEHVRFREIITFEEKRLTKLNGQCMCEAVTEISPAG
jgi:hypothetical protein